MQENLNELRKDCLLEVHIWNGRGPNPGINSTIITKEKIMYSYHHYYRTSEEYISEGIRLEEKDYKKIINFIETNIIDKDIKSYNMRDSSVNVKGHYKNISFNICNNRKFLGEIGVCDMAMQIIREIKEGK